jgi:hypothetical protein
MYGQPKVGRSKGKIVVVFVLSPLKVAGPSHTRHYAGKLKGIMVLLHFHWTMGILVGLDLTTRGMRPGIRECCDASLSKV